MECSPQLSKSTLEGRVYNDNRAVTSRSVDICGHYMGGNIIMCVSMCACMRECVHVCMTCAERGGALGFPQHGIEH